jgi:biopolymer transport protein ExbD
VRLERRGRRRRILDLAPLVDVVFLLLVFFMLATQFDRERALPLDVTGAGSAEREEPAPIEVRLAADGRLWLDGRAGDLETLTRRLARTPGGRVAVRPEADVSLGRIHDVLEIVAESEVASASLVRGF